MKRYDENPIWGDYFSNVETAYQISQRDRELRSLQKDVEATIQEVESLENVLESTEWSSNATKQHDKAVRTVDKSFKQYEEFVTDLSEKYDNAIEVIDELLPIVFTFLKKTAAIVISKDTEEVCKWANENLQNDWDFFPVVYGGDMVNIYYMEDHKDRTLFKMTWCD